MGRMTDQTLLFPPAHKSNVGTRTFCHLPLATSSGGRSAFTWQTCPVLVVTKGDASDEEAAMEEVCLNACCAFVVQLEWKVRVGRVELGTFSSLGPALIFLAGRASTLMQVYNRKGLGVCLESIRVIPD